MIADYILDLAEFDVSDVEEAVRQYRKSGAEFFPKPGVLDKLASTVRSQRHATTKPLKPEFGDTRALMWWTFPKTDWKAHWRECEVPSGQKVQDVRGGKFRDPQRGAL